MKPHWKEAWATYRSIETSKDHLPVNYFGKVDSYTFLPNDFHKPNPFLLPEFLSLYLLSKQWRPFLINNQEVFERRPSADPRVVVQMRMNNYSSSKLEMKRSGKFTHNNRPILGRVMNKRQILKWFIKRIEWMKHAVLQFHLAYDSVEGFYQDWQQRRAIQIETESDILAMESSDNRRKERFISVFFVVVLVLLNDPDSITVETLAWQH